LTIKKNRFTLVSVEGNTSFTEGLKEAEMAVNPPNDNRRIGMVRQRSQVFNPTTDTWVKRDSTTGRFMDVKSDGTPFKGVRKEK
jgi:hypothetical protein